MSSLHLCHLQQERPQLPVFLLSVNKVEGQFPPVIGVDVNPIVPFRINLHAPSAFGK